MTDPIPEDLRDTLEMAQSGMVNIGGKYAVQLIERIARLEAENERLRAPVSDEEFVKRLIGIITWQHQVIHCSHDGANDNCSYEICKCATLIRKELEAIIASRKGASEGK